MIPMIWITQTAVRFGDTELFTVFCLAICTWIFFSKIIPTNDEILGLLQRLILVCIYISSLIWNNKTQRQDERKAMNPKKGKKKKKETPPPEILDDKKKKNKKKKKSPQKKIVFMENKEPPVLKEKTKVYSSLETCRKLNMDSGSIYDCLLQYKLTKTELQLNNFPSEDYRPQTLVDANDRICIRCQQQFEIYNGVYLSSTKCEYHPRRAIFSANSGSKVYPCCDLPVGSLPCSVSNHHVTLQHGPKQMTKTASKRYIKRDLQRRIFGLDCEMSYTTQGLEVTRIGIVDIDGCTVYDSYVKPKNKILDYNTLYSGVEKRHLDKVTITTDDVKKILNSFIYEDTILVGHALNNDLAALGLIHNTIVDTSVLYSDTGCPMMKRSLKSLASKLLGMSIQDDPSGHDCIEDARACLQLALLKIPPKPSEASPFLNCGYFSDGWRQPSIENGDFHWAQKQQRSSIHSGHFPYEQEQPQPLMEIQNFYLTIATSSSPDQQISGTRVISSRNPSVCYPTSVFQNFDTPKNFRYDPNLGCHRNYSLDQAKRGV